LLSRAFESAATLGARAMFLEVSVTNIAAQALYTRAGFEQAGRRREYYSDRSDAMVLRRDLG
jgi:ribosomal-protein-alanine N-acetyltransferase